jgi:hypothetical protein
MTDLSFHPLADIFPLMEGVEFDALVEDIYRNGLREPIVLHEGKILDGRNRYRACIKIAEEAEAQNCCGQLYQPQFKELEPRIGVGIDPYAYVISANIHRRHLTAEQRRELIAKVLKADPEESDRSIGEKIKADHKTVAAERSKLEATGEIPQSTLRKEKGGRKQRVRKDAAKRAGATKAAKKAAEMAEPVDEAFLSNAERWHLSLGALAGEAVAMRSFWDKEFEKWRTFEVTSDLLTLAKQARDAWSSLIGELESRNRPTEVDQTDGVAASAEVRKAEAIRANDYPDLPEFLRR